MSDTQPFAADHSLFSAVLHAQVVGALLSGTLKYATGAGMPRAVVTVRNTGTGA